LRENVIKFLGSRGLSMGLLITGAVYFFYLTILWLLDLRPAPFMLWSPISVLSVPFLANLITNLLTRRYAHTGNILFHAAFVIILIGLRISLLARFEGEFTLTEGESFFGDEKEYTSYTASDEFDESAPRISLRLDSVTPEFWEDKFHFTRLESNVRYPATTLRNIGIIRLNGGLKMDGARLRLTSFGYAPEVLLENLRVGTIHRSATKMAVFPPGSEDHLQIGSYRVFIKVLSDPVSEAGKLRNKSMNLVDPVFLVKVTWVYQSIFEGVLKKGEEVRFGSFKISFEGIKYWTGFGVVKDPGEPVVIAGLIALVLGLFLRLLPDLYRKGRTG
jgi:cytochrome c biogenesis protein ResB